MAKETYIRTYIRAEFQGTYDDKSFVGTGILPLAPPIHAVLTTSGCKNANL